MFEIKNLHVSVDGEAVLNGIDLAVNSGEVHAIMGPNASGKSTLAKVIAGHPAYKIEKGEIEYELDGKKINLLALEPHERARKGVFMAFQYPVEVPGVNNFAFLEAAFNEVCKEHGAEEMDAMDFEVFLREKTRFLDMDEKYINRPLNADFSGGEKKRNEILQMAVLSPRISFLDETDSGLDVDALRAVANGINKLRNKNNAVVLITHYQRLLGYVVPDFVHIMLGGKIIRSGGKELALEVEERGYEWLIKRDKD